MGRRKFTVPHNIGVAAGVLEGYFEWFPSILMKIEGAARSAALGTKYEDQVLRIAMVALELHGELSKPDLYGEFNLS
jgi:hypothetical protein